VSDVSVTDWQWWELVSLPQRARRVTLRVRTTDLASRTHPERREWNRLGYGYPTGASSHSLKRVGSEPEFNLWEARVKSYSSLLAAPVEIGSRLKTAG
jgi:hypothetical protein